MLKKLPLTFMLSFCREKVPSNGEDSYCYSFSNTSGMLGVFDGCGGAGARRHDYYSNKTEAYMASRLCAGAFYDAFRSHCPLEMSVEEFAEQVLKPTTVEQLVRFQPPKSEDGPVLRGSMVRTLPSTAAVAIVESQEDDSVKVSALWAGDSRVYILDGDGLAQLTVDDASVKDPMLNIYEDGVLRNMFASDRPVRLNFREVVVKPPFIVLTATDGCYGYVSTPMEYEGLLLHTLLGAANVAQWENTLADTIGNFAGDDHTMCLAAFGYKSFEGLKQSFAPRMQHLWETYIAPLQGVPVEVREPRFALWDQYKQAYFRYLEDGQI